MTYEQFYKPQKKKALFNIIGAQQAEIEALKYTVALQKGKISSLEGEILNLTDVNENLAANAQRLSEIVGDMV